MATSSTILTLDIGAAGIRAAQFDVDSANNIILTKFASREYDEELKDTNRRSLIERNLRELLQSTRFTAKRVLLSISGQFALTRFVKLPPVSGQESRVRQIVEFEARQNVPFPMEEVVWDYQLIANPEAEELEAMFVVVKNDIVDDITSAVQAVDLNPILVDVSTCAAYNAARANGIGEDGCSMVLDVGGRSTNLMFVDRNQLFTRTIPIAGVAITQQIAKELGISYSEAERVKYRQGFVGLGGAYEDPASEVAAAVSKIIRGVMTRLHGEVNRSVTLYRTQQKGEKPSKLYLTGGTSALPHTDTFFAEKLGMEVEYLNTFKVVRLAPDLDVERLENEAHGFSQAVGLALRYRGACPVEVNLLPRRIRRLVAFEQKKTWLGAAALCVLLLLTFSLFSNMYMAQVYEPVVEQFREQRQELEEKESELSGVESEISNVEDQYQRLNRLLRRREDWVRVVNSVEAEIPGRLWFTEFRPVFEDLREEEEERRPERDAPASPFSRRRDRDDEPRREDEERDPDEIELEESGPRGRITGIAVRGHSLSLPPGVRIDGQDVGDEELEELAREELEEAADELEDIEAPEEVPDNGRGPEQVLLSRLRRLPVFVEDRVDFDEYEVSDQVFNLRTFTIRARLEEPIDLEY